jgi:hypothetical protein
MNIKGRGSRRKEKAPELLEFKDLQTSFYYFRGAGGCLSNLFIKFHRISNIM